ncbi:hypothetical protein [Robiginitalea biformata]|uniref:Uncharacterized protein n=1 Tax=Robiginitalea biformata (strain ATCC BAA-864 / DSM 15991 / KCTC 12146 / HTCC2501) TaxID=313596 RepID=A4CPW4_ROBBH|nr:hypothetical protein [Robiginitalea biformata]EAR14049.1 hypothetical protein RB2501_01445 [Robiginitalea biformata HTCC2501]
MNSEYQNPKWNLRAALFFFVLTLAMLIAASCEKPTMDEYLYGANNKIQRKTENCYIDLNTDCSKLETPCKEVCELLKGE